ncbi:hypothetical protein [Alteromonas macleodii]|uniref:hypothetical protein n=1 Tax=Alteromonas macleodii TaxID=28108 RepID=UPI00066BC91E|nr:hypothetical protein [Alteromonas macleodii]CAI3940695.1 hypothetical protein MIT1002_01058 [Alteromonas macleodii]VTP51032.1 hypothetical protein MIT1002_01058 [Alteromonas macleodii]
MSNDIFSSVYDLSVKLANCISEEKYDDAKQKADLLDEQVRQFDRAALLNLDDEQIGFLRELAHWLTDQDGIMQERSKNLINIIAPLNERSVLNHRNKY